MADELSRVEDLLENGVEEPVEPMSEIEAILRGEGPKPHSRVADLLLKYNPSDVLIDKSVTANGTYVARNDDADGYSTVVVDVPSSPPPVLDTLDVDITQNGEYSYTPQHDGYSSVSVDVDVEPNVDSKSISANGTYQASDDNLDGYSSVSVNVQPNLGTKSITANGTYNASSDNKDGYSQVTVNVPSTPPVIQSKSITKNGTYTAPSGVDGYSPVTVNVPGYKPQSYSASDIITFSDGVNLPMLSCVANIEAVQSGSGDPSPTNVRPITGWTGCNLGVSGKNLIEDKLTGSNISSSGVIGAQSEYDVHFAKVVQGVTYTFTTDDSAKVCAFYSSKPTNGSTSYNSSRQTGNSTVIAPITGYIAFRTKANYAYAQCEVGSTATTYEPYAGTTYNVSWSSQGTIYGGYVDLCSGVLVVTHACIDMGDINYSYVSDRRLFIAYRSAFIAAGLPVKKADICDCKCSCYAEKTVLITDLYFSQTSASSNVNFKDTNYSDATAFKTAVTGKQFCYEILEPQTYQLTPSQVKTLLADNVIFADCGKVSAEVWKYDAPITDYYLHNGLVGSDGGSYITTPLDKTMTNGVYKVTLRDDDITAHAYFIWQGSTVSFSIEGGSGFYTMEVTSTTAGLTYWAGAWRNIYADIEKICDI